MPISFGIATRIPIMNTSIMLHGSMWRRIRKANGSAHGTRPSRIGVSR